MATIHSRCYFSIFQHGNAAVNVASICRISIKHCPCHCKKIRDWFNTWWVISVAVWPDPGPSLGPHLTFCHGLGLHPLCAQGNFQANATMHEKWSPANKHAGLEQANFCWSGHFQGMLGGRGADLRQAKPALPRVVQRHAPPGKLLISRCS